MSNKYPSRYSHGKEVSAAQYITELICEKKSAIDGADLPAKFWTLPKWTSFYRQQIVSANALLRLYHPTAIIRALQSPQSKFVFSLRAPHLDAIIKAEQARHAIFERNKQNAALEKPRPVVDVNAKPRVRQSKSTNLSKLRELDGKEEGNT